jgi:hypothetical protein
MTTRFALLAVVLAAAGCSIGADGSKATSVASSTSGNAGPDQANLCEVSAWQHEDVARACKPGQKVVYLPQTFGNEQLPVFFAAVNCDLRYSVALTTGAVTCIYGPITPKAAAPAKSER